MNGTRAAVTGATGHIGAHVAQVLLDRGYSLTLLVRRLTPQLEKLRDGGAQIHLCDLARPETYQPILQGQDVLFHLAAENTTDTTDEARVIAASLGLTEKVIPAALSAGVPTIVYTSSVVVLGRSPRKELLLNEKDTVAFPESPYVKGKLLAEQWVASKVKEGADIRRVYPSWVVGPGDPKMTPPHKFIKDFAAKGQLVYFGGGVSMAHVDDVALGHVLAYEKGARQGQYVLSGENISFQDLYRKLAQVFRQKEPKIKIPKWLIYTGAKILGKNSPVQASYVEAVIDRYSWYDHSRASTELGYAPRSIDAILQDVSTETRARIMGTLRLRDRQTSAPASGAEKGTLLITGFPGWLGNRMVDILMNGDELGRNKTDRTVRLLVQPHMKALVPPLPTNFELVEGDITDKESLLRATQGVSAVWHLAGVIYPPKLELFDLVNIQGTRNLADACVANGVQRFLYMSTDSCCGFTPKERVFSANEPANPYKNYGRSKYAGEEYLMALTAQGKLKATSLRGFWFFGPNVPERNLGFLRSFSWPFQPVFGNGRNLRSISHCDDLVNAFCLAETSSASIGKWYWLPTFMQPQTVDAIYEMIGSGLGKKTNLFHIPNLACDFFDWADNLLTKQFQTLNATVHAAGKFHKTIATDAAGAAPARQDFGWEPKVTVAQIQREISDSLANS